MTSPGDRQLGDYRLLEPIGAGGMGEVYLAEHVHLRKQYALKILPADLARAPGFVERFHDEARMMADLRHPHIVQVHYMGHQDETYYLVMDYVTGPDGKPQSLQDVIQRDPKAQLPQAHVRTWAIQITEALGYAHGRGVVHRDIKPGNILLDANGEAHLSDFGLAKAFGAEAVLFYLQDSIQRSLTGGRTIRPGAGADDDTLDARNVKPDGDPANPRPRNHVNDSLDGQDTLVPDGSFSRRRSGSGGSGIVGTYDYMSPEQRGEGGEIDHRSDIYALGVIFYRLLTGRRPVGIATPPSRIAPTIDPQWDAITTRCMAYAQEDRYESCENLVADLRSIPDDGAAAERTEEARQHLAAGRYAEARQTADRLGELGKAGERLAAQLLQEFGGYAQNLCAGAEEAIAAGNFDEARRLWADATALAPDLPNVARLRESLQSSEDLNSLVHGLREAFAAEDFPTVQEILERLRSFVGAGVAGAATVLADAEASVGQRAADLARQAERELADGNLHAAAVTIGKARAADPTGEIVGPVAERIERLTLAETLGRDFESLLREKQYAKAREAVEQLETLGEEGTAGAVAGREHLKVVCRELTRQAVAAMKQKQAREAVELATAALDASPDDAATQDVLAKAKALARSLELYERIKKHIANREYKDVQGILAELRQIEVYGPALVATTEKHLQGVSKKLAEEAQEAVLAGQWSRARELLAQAVAANPNDAEAAEMLREVDAELAKQAKGRNRRATAIRWAITCGALVFVFCVLRWACNGCASWMRSIEPHTRQAVREAEKGAGKPGTPNVPATWGDGLEMASLSRLGYRSAFSVSLDTALDINAVETALRNRFGEVARAGSTLYLPRIGPGASAAWVRAGDGFIVLADQGELSSEGNAADLTVAWYELAQAIRAVTASPNQVDLAQQFQETLKAGTVVKGQYQRLFLILNHNNGEGVLKWPSAKPAWARFSLLKTYGGRGTVFSLQRKTFLSGINYQANSADLGSLPFGDHLLQVVNAGWHYTRGADSQVVIHAFFAQPKERIALTNPSQWVRSVESESQELSAFSVPQLDRQPQLTQPKPGPGEATATSLGLRSGFAANLGCALNLRAVQQAIEKQGWRSRNGNNACVAWRTAQPDLLAWISADGRLVVGGKANLASVAQVDALEKTWLAVAEIIASVTASVAAKEIDSTMRQGRFYTEKARQYQRLLVMDLPKGPGGPPPQVRESLRWPDSSTSWGRLTLRCAWNPYWTKLSLDERPLPLPGGTAPTRSIDLSGTASGVHSLHMEALDPQWLMVDVFCENPQDAVSLYDAAWKPQATASGLSRPIEDLILPATGVPRR